MTTQLAPPPAAEVPAPSPAAAVADRRLRGGLAIVPAAALVIAFFFYPLGHIVWLSFTDPTTGVGNYTDLASDGISVKVLTRTLIVSSAVASLAVLIAYPYAYAMTRVGPRTRAVLTVFVLMPFWTSLMARNFAWYLIEQRGGVIDQAFQLVGIDGVVLLGTLAGVTIAMVQVMLPFAVLPLYTSLNTIDRRLMDAATSCGAPWHRAFRTIYLPLSRPGLVSAFSLVMILSLGFYVTPAILGSPQQALVSQLIAVRVGDLLDFGAGGALGLVLLALTLVMLAVVATLGRQRKDAHEA